MTRSILGKRQPAESRFALSDFGTLPIKHGGLMRVAFGFVARVLCAYLLAGLGIGPPVTCAAPLAAWSTLLWSRIQVRQRRAPLCTARLSARV